MVLLAVAARSDDPRRKVKSSSPLLTRQGFGRQAQCLQLLLARKFGIPGAVPVYRTDYLVGQFPGVRRPALLPVLNSRIRATASLVLG